MDTMTLIIFTLWTGIIIGLFTAMVILAIEDAGQ